MILSREELTQEELQELIELKKEKDEFFMQNKEIISKYTLLSREYYDLASRPDGFIYIIIRNKTIGLNYKKAIGVNMFNLGGFNHMEHRKYPKAVEIITNNKKLLNSSYHDNVKITYDTTNNLNKLLIETQKEIRKFENRKYNNWKTF